MSTKAGKEQDSQTSIHGPELQEIATDEGPVGISIFEKDTPPRFRVTGLSRPTFKVQTKRPDGDGEMYRFVNRGAYWESAEEIPEPHEFEVAVTIDHGGRVRTYHARFDEHEHDHHHDVDGPPPEPPPGPIAQSVAIGFRTVYAVTLLLAVVWLGSNIRQIAPDSQAIVMRFDRIVRVQDSGLLLAWPRPIEQVVLVPGPDRQLSQAVGALPPVGGITQTPPNAAGVGGIPATASAYLTGDGNVVFLDAKLIYRISDPRAFVLSETHVSPGLDRLFRATAVRITAGWGLNDFVVAQPNETNGAAGQSIVALRTAVRDQLLKEMNAKLQELSGEGVGFGVEVAQIDLTAWLPPEAKIAFDAVLTATQAADQQVAAARTAAELRRQGAQREGDRLTSAAEATASERVTTATVDTAAIKALVAEETKQTRESLMLRAYNEKIAQIISRAGSVTLVDPQSGARFVLPGKQP